MSTYLFVYGTLRPGEVRWSALSNYTIGEPKSATIEESALFNMGGFPALICDQDGSVTGDLVQIRLDFVDHVMAVLDRIEGYIPSNPRGSLYIRSIKTVTTADGPVEAWVYEAGEEIKDLALNYVGGAPRIESGDWKQQ